MSEVRVALPRSRKNAQAGMRPAFTALPPLTVYVHFPWCERKCPYCDFNSHAVKDTAPIPEARYLDALARDLEASLPLAWGRRVHAVFLGGGTPSLLSAEGFDRLLATLRALLPLEADAEITLEANPGSVEARRFAAYRKSGANRLSLGIQSFDAAHLRAIGRIHDGEQARHAARVAADTFENFNFDLMYALPGQTPDDLARDLDTALSFDPPHLSLYHLSIEPNTVFAKHPPVLPDDDAAAAMQDGIAARLISHGWDHYEVSAWARAGRRSRHNLNYWMFGDYLGLGAGAHGKLSFPDHVLRTEKPRNPESYMAACEAGADIGSRREVAAGELPFEFMLNALRLNAGVATSLFSERTGLPLEAVLPRIVEAERRGLIERTPTTLRPSARGRAFLNDLQELFL